MEALVIVALFIAFAAVAVWFGHDSREHMASDEERFAREGFIWEGNQP